LSATGSRDDGASAPSAFPPGAQRAPHAWRAGRFELVLDRPFVMGIVNVTPDSFFDGGRDASAALRHCEVLLREGADILDIGGESTRPGASKPTASEELARILPVVRHACTLDVPVSVDTSDPFVIGAVLDAGADIVNDVRALARPGALERVARHPTAGVCLMHMQGEPGTMQRAPTYVDVVAEVAAFLRGRAAAVEAAGVGRRRIVVDPGIGFGKTPEHNLALLVRQQTLLQTLPFPLLVGWSRKSTLGVVTGRAVDDRLVASIAAALASVMRGAHILRVHDVAATVDALGVWRAAGLGWEHNVTNTRASGGES
jgi:dihydropteroate synthase